VVERVSEVAQARGIDVPRMEIPAWVNTEDNSVPAGADVMRWAAGLHRWAGLGWLGWRHTPHTHMAQTPHP
jgi:hypothetical protein